MTNAYDEDAKDGQHTRGSTVHQVSASNGHSVQPDSEREYSVKPSATNGAVSKQASVLKDADKPGSDDAVRPPDGGYGWIIALTSMSFQFLVAATIMSFTILYVEFSRVFGQPKGVIGWASSILTLFSNISGIFVSVFLRRYGARPVAMTGSLFATIGFVSSSLISNVYQLYFTFGVLTGFGIGSMLYSSIVIVQEWFDKRRALAAGFATVGMSLGNIVVGPLVRILLEHYGWRGCLVLLGGITLHGLPLAMLIRPSPSRPRYNSTMWKMFQGILDFSMLKRPIFLFYCVGSTLNYMSLIAWLQHLGSRAHALGLTPYQVSTVPTFLAIFSLTGRLVFTVVANCSCTDRLLMYACGILAGGVIMVTSYVVDSYVLISLFAAGVGLTMGIHLPIHSTLIVDLFGISSLIRGQAILTCFFGVGALIGTPMAGFIFDATQDYNVTFLIMGSLVLIGAMFTFLIYYLTHRHKRRSQSVDVSLEGKNIDDVLIVDDPPMKVMNDADDAAERMDECPADVDAASAEEMAKDACDVERNDDNLDAVQEGVPFLNSTCPSDNGSR